MDEIINIDSPYQTTVGGIQARVCSTAEGATWWGNEFHWCDQYFLSSFFSRACSFCFSVCYILSRKWGEKVRLNEEEWRILKGNQWLNSTLVDFTMAYVLADAAVICFHADSPCS